MHAVCYRIGTPGIVDGISNWPRGRANANRQTVADFIVRGREFVEAWVVHRRRTPRGVVRGTRLLVASADSLDRSKERSIAILLVRFIFAGLYRCSERLPPRVALDLGDDLSDAFLCA